MSRLGVARGVRSTQGRQVSVVNTGFLSESEGGVSLMNIGVLMELNLDSKCSQTCLNRSTMALILNCPIREVLGFGSYKILTVVLYQRSFGTQLKRSI